jgi:hypothetical protein
VTSRDIGAGAKWCYLEFVFWWSPISVMVGQVIFELVGFLF